MKQLENKINDLEIGLKKKSDMYDNLECVNE